MTKVAPRSLADQRRYWHERWARQGPLRPPTASAYMVLELLKPCSSNPAMLDCGRGAGWFPQRAVHRGWFKKSVSAERFDVGVSQPVLAHVEDSALCLDMMAGIPKPYEYRTANRLAMERWNHALRRNAGGVGARLTATLGRALPARSLGLAWRTRHMSLIGASGMKNAAPAVERLGGSWA